MTTNFFEPFVGYTTSTVASLSSQGKTKFFVSVIPAAIGFFLDLEYTALATGLIFLVVMDSVSALIAAYKTKTPITSRRLSKTALKLFVYMPLIATSHILGVAIPVLDMEFFMLVFLTATESLSILENIARAGYAVPKRILSKINGVLQEK